jgi:hypothetical protein
MRSKYKFQHTRVDPDGRRCLIWASDGPGRGEVFALGVVPVGSPAHLEVRRSQLWTPNNLADEGKLDMLDVYFEDQAVRASVFGRLYNDTPVDTDGLADLTGEVSGTGYGALEWTRGTDWGAPSINGSGNGEVVGVEKTYTAGGSWSAATHFVLATVGSGTSGLLIAYAALAATRTLVDTDTLDVIPTVEQA